jgi:hypothetical protein
MYAPAEGNIWMHLPFMLLIAAILISHYWPDGGKRFLKKDRNVRPNAAEPDRARPERAAPPTLR